MKPGLIGIRLAVFTLLSTSILTSCGSDGSDDPRQVVIALFGAMEKNDQARIAHLLDLPELMRNVEEDYALAGGRPRVFTDPRQILEDLTHDGETKKRWFALQRIVNRSEIIGETAFVEVTFVDKESSHGYLTKFALRKSQGRWKIYSFRTEQEAP